MQMLVRILEPLFTNCMVLEKLINFSESQFSHLKIEDNIINL